MMSDLSPLDTDRDLLISKLSQETGYSELFLKIATKRGQAPHFLKTKESIHDFLYPSLSNLTSPFKIKDLEKVVLRLKTARHLGEKIFVYGDYDVDGTTGASLLFWVLEELGFKVQVSQGNRFTDGYGLVVRAVEEAHANQSTVLMSVDCGITSFDAATRARELGIDLIVIDHHQVSVEKGLPQAFAIINPQQTDCPSDLKDTCGCGLAFYLSLGLRKGLDRPDIHLKKHLDLVTLATAADMVKLSGDNRILVRHGMGVLQNTDKIGLRALLSASQLLGKKMSPSSLGFVLGPRINASSRMGHEKAALKLLTSKDPLEAAHLASHLELLNQERTQVQESMVKRAIELGYEKIKLGTRQSLVVWDPSFHEGVVGIVATKLVEEFKCSSVVIALSDGIAKGSIRSDGVKDILEALNQCGALLKGFGGHRHAAGLSVDPSQLLLFEQAFEDAITKQVHLRQSKGPSVDAVVSPDDITLKALQEIEMLAPFGPGNPEPTLLIKDTLFKIEPLKDRHLRLKIGNIDGIWFGVPQQMRDKLKISRPYSWKVVPEINRFRGQEKISLRVKEVETH